MQVPGFLVLGLPIALLLALLYGTDTEGATDASPASDLGFMRQAAAFHKVLRKILK